MRMRLPHYERLDVHVPDANVAADGAGTSLQRRAENLFGNDPASWTEIPNQSVPPQYSYDIPVTEGKRRYLRIRVTSP